MSDPVVYTAGHSNRTSETFLSLLKNCRIEVVVDIRRFPSSKKFPHFNKGALKDLLQHAGVEYMHLEGLGGRRTPLRGSPNTALNAPGFRAYADHMRTRTFQEDFKKLLTLAGTKTAVLMCAEALPWRCHRWLLSDYLVLPGIKVIHILRPSCTVEHRPTASASLDGELIVYSNR